MATMLEALSDNSFDLVNKRDLTSNFSRKLLDYRKEIILDFEKNKVNLNQAIAKIAKRDNLNDDKINRIIEEVNNQVYLIQYSKMKDNLERKVSFEIASPKKVKSIMGGNSEDSPKEDSKEEKSACNFDEAFEKTASENIGENFLVRDYGYSVCLNIDADKEYGIQMIKKIASEISHKKADLELASKEFEKTASSVVTSLIKLNNSGEDVNKILSKTASEMKLAREDINFFSDMISEGIDYIRNDNASLVASFPIIKVATENNDGDFSLGKYSYNKTANEKIKTVEVNGKELDSIQDVINIVQKAKDSKDKSQKLASELVLAISKCASLGIDEKRLNKISAGANVESVFPNLFVHKQEKVASDDFNALKAINEAFASPKPRAATVRDKIESKLKNEDVIKKENIYE